MKSPAPFQPQLKSNLERKSVFTFVFQYKIYIHFFFSNDILNENCQMKSSPVGSVGSTDHSLGINVLLRANHKFLLRHTDSPYFALQLHLSQTAAH